MMKRDVGMVVMVVVVETTEKKFFLFAKFKTDDELVSSSRP